MGVERVFQHMPFVELLGIDISVAEDGHAEGSIEMDEKLRSNPNKDIAHGGVPFALADTVGGAAAVSLVHGPSPTVDMRIDYLDACTDDLHAEADVIREGKTTAVVDVEIHDADGVHVADAKGVYKISGFKQESPHKWSKEDVEEIGGL